MLLQKLKKEARILSIGERIELVKDIIDSLEIKTPELSDKTKIIQEMKGLLKTDETAPTDEEIANILTEHKIKKYL